MIVPQRVLLEPLASLSQTRGVEARLTLRSVAARRPLNYRRGRWPNTANPHLIRIPLDMKGGRTICPPFI